MLILSLFFALVGNWGSGDARFSYTLRFHPDDTSAVSIRLLVRNAPASMQLAANAHPEYDDKYWRYVDNMAAATVSGRTLTISKVDSVRWQVNNPAGDVVVTYRVKFPREPRPRASWRPFLASTGGLVGGPHSFLYIVGLEHAAADVTLDIPAGWKVATGLDGKSTARHFTAPDIYALMESPILVGELSEWMFKAGSTPHHVFYWRLPEGVPFDSTKFVAGLAKVANGAIALFGSAPYREYSFLFQDGAWGGGLEHPNSVTLGAESEQLARNPLYTLDDAAHEFIHSWNLMSIEPAEYRGVDYRMQGPVAELWFSEGLTLFYADLLQRRAGIAMEESTRIAHLETLMQRYLSSPGNARNSAERISSVEYNASPAALGDYTASAHLVGELLGTIIDLRIRDATNGVRSVDDVMRLMYERFTKKKFTSHDVEQAASETCSCSMADIFDRHVFNASAIAFNRYLVALGLMADVTWEPAVGNDGKPRPDLRAWAWEEDGALKLRVGDPESIWGKAGLRTGDVIVSVNEAPMKLWPDLRSVMRNIAIGDTVMFVVQRDRVRMSRTVVVRGYDRPRVTIRHIDRPSQRQEKLYRQWIETR
ncbi:MAG: PDZ domain-containing protein [Gemmatimonadaceae bacterium]